MIVGVISDTHDRLSAIDLALTFFRQHKVDVVVHCGDWKTVDTMNYFLLKAAEVALPVKGVLGNNDLDVDAFMQCAKSAAGDVEIEQDILTFKAGDKQITVYHSHHKPTLRKVLADESNDIVLLGHSHKPLITFETDKLVVNPGSTAFSIPRSTTWVPTVAIVDTTTMVATIELLTK